MVELVEANVVFRSGVLAVIQRNLTKVTAEEEIIIMDRFNLRPRKCLDFRTPYEVFFGLTVALTT